MVKTGLAFAASGLLTYFVGDSLLRRRQALLHDDSHLRERVRKRVAELVSYPDAIDVQVEGHLIRVSGRVLATELDGLLSQLTQVPRVYRVYNTLVPVKDASGLRQRAAA
ncbi:MAG: hypothetical protein JWP43_2784 [Ramlibacter sp.]|jgi:hypothetical protein|nr:hypothetical protein [Ramlibacter sp.]